MKAVLNNDIILYITERGDTEIGSIPPEKKGIGLERLRWTGSEIVDLADLNEMWVKELGPGFYELHAIEVPGSQLIAMRYIQRHYLTSDNGVIRVKSIQELQDERERERLKQIKNRLVAKLNRDVGDFERRLLDAYKLILALIVYARQQPQQLADFFDLLIPHIKDTFPLSQVQDELMSAAQSLKVFIDEYYNEIDS